MYSPCMPALRNYLRLAPNKVGTSCALFTAMSPPDKLRPGKLRLSKIYEPNVFTFHHLSQPVSAGFLNMSQQYLWSLFGLTYSAKRRTVLVEAHPCDPHTPTAITFHRDSEYKVNVYASDYSYHRLGRLCYLGLARKLGVRLRVRRS